MMPLLALLTLLLGLLLICAMIVPSRLPHHRQLIVLYHVISDDPFLANVWIREPTIIVLTRGSMMTGDLMLWMWTSIATAVVLDRIDLSRRLLLLIWLVIVQDCSSRLLPLACLFLMWMDRRMTTRIGDILAATGSTRRIATDDVNGVPLMMITIGRDHNGIGMRRRRHRHLREIGSRGTFPRLHAIGNHEMNGIGGMVIRELGRPLRLLRGLMMGRLRRGR